MSVLLLGKSLVKDVIEGNTAIVEKILIREEYGEICLLKSCICEGLELAEEPTVEGIHALARLMAVSGTTVIADSDKSVDFDRIAVFTCDSLLSYLISPAFENVNVTAVFDDLSIADISPVTGDADVVAALLCVKEGDKLYTKRFANVLKSVEVFADNVSVEERREWAVSEEFISEQRAKVFSHGGKLY